MSNPVSVTSSSRASDFAISEPRASPCILTCIGEGEGVFAGVSVAVIEAVGDCSGFFDGSLSATFYAHPLTKITETTTKAIIILFENFIIQQIPLRRPEY